METTAAQSPDRGADKQPRQRRWIPLSFRVFVAMLLAAATASALLLGIPAYQRLTVGRQLGQLGLKGMYATRGPKWLQNVLGDEFGDALRDFTCIMIPDTGCTDALVAKLRCYSNLRQLELAENSITDRALDAL